MIATPDRPLTPAARRILDVASELFYWRGIHAVGVDTIAAEAGVTKKTLYDRFGSKDALIAAYLSKRDEQWRQVVTEHLGREHADPVDRALAPFDALAEWMGSGRTDRGCSFVNAFAELADPQHPGQRVIRAEKQWLRDRFVELVVAAGVADPERLASQLVTLHEGAIVTFAVLGERESVLATKDAARQLLAAAPRSSRTS